MNKVKVVAHRGDPSVAPENTIPAIKRAVELGVDMIEFDVQMTKDKHLILMHDEVVDNVTDGKGRVHDLTLEQIKKLKVSISRVTDDDTRWVNLKLKESAEVPLFEEVISVIPSPIQLNVHLKIFDNSIAEISEKKVIVPFLQDRELKERTFVAVDTVKTLERIRQTDPSINCILLEGQEDPEKYVYVCRDFGLKLLQPWRNILTKEFMDDVHNAGMKANVFWADAERDMEHFISCGVDGIFTHLPERMIKFMR